MKKNDLTNAQQKMVLDNYNLIYTAIKGFHIEKNYCLDIDDLKQISLMALCNATATFDESRGVEFSTYAVRVMRNHLSNELRRYNRSGIDLNTEQVSMNETFGYGDEGGPAFEVADPSCELRFDASIELMDLDKEINRMENSSSGDRNRDHNLKVQALIIRLLMAEKSVSEICEELKISLATYYRQLEAARKHLAAAIGYAY